MNRIPSFAARFPASPPFLPCLMVLLLAGASSPLREQASAVCQVAHLSSKAASERVLHRVQPEYPAIARINYIQGRVKLEVLVGRKGSVTRIHILEGQPILAAAAFKAVRKWLYRPLETSSAGDSFMTEINVNFSLHFQKLADLPNHAEKFLNDQVHPPEVMAQPQAEALATRMPLKVLVDSDGRVLDSMPLAPANNSLETARRNVQGWKFRPARWGTLNIPWYVKVEVPIGHKLLGRGGNDSNAP